MKANIAGDLARAEKVDLGPEPNSIRAQYQDGSEVTFTDVEIYYPGLIRAMFRRGLMPKAVAVRELKKLGLRLKPSAEEPS